MTNLFDSQLPWAAFGSGVKKPRFSLGPLDSTNGLAIYFRMGWIGKIMERSQIHTDFRCKHILHMFWDLLLVRYGYFALMSPCPECLEVLVDVVDLYSPRLLFSETFLWVFRRFARTWEFKVWQNGWLSAFFNGGIFLLNSPETCNRSDWTPSRES